MDETTKDPAAQATRRDGRGLRLALAVSVAVNLGVLGIVAGVAWHGGPGGRGTMLREIGFGPYEGALRPEDRLALRGALRDRLGDIRAARGEMQQDIAAILAALRAEPFSPEGLSAAMAAQADHLAGHLRFGSDVLRDHLLAMPEQERLDFARRMEAQLSRGPAKGDPSNPDASDQ